MEGLSSQASARLAFRARYMQRFLPLLSCIREKSALRQRHKAVKKAADLSLACAAGRTSWSIALCRSLFMNGRAKKQQTHDRGSSGVSMADKAGRAFLKRLRRRRSRARARPVSYRQHFLHARKLQVNPNAKLQQTRFSSAQYADFEVSKLCSLSELIPGGLRMDLPKLLDQTAHYIISLQLQVDAMSFLGQSLST